MAEPKYTHRIVKPWTGYQQGQLVDASDWRNTAALERTRFIVPIEPADSKAHALGSDEQFAPKGVQVEHPKRQGKGGKATVTRRNAETGEMETVEGVPTD